MPRTHVAKLDRTTLPAGTKLVILDNRNAGDAGSRFVDLKNGELQKADFAVAECGPELDQQIEVRRKALAGPAEIVQAVGMQLSATATTISGTDARTLPASGALGLPGAAGKPAIRGPGTTDAPSATQPVGAVADAGGPVGRQQQGVDRPLYPGAPHPAGPELAPAPADPFAVPLEEVAWSWPGDRFLPAQDGQVMAST